MWTNLSLPKGVCMLMLIIASSSAHAVDLPIVLISESELPFSLSPSNFDNSPSNFSNSISNFENSASNFQNSESNFQNSSSNYNNGPNGNKRLIQTGNGTKVVGYYVVAESGVTNFFSPNGKRLFYNPKKGAGIFGGKDGSFCGVLIRGKNALSLELTEDGAKLLFLLE